MATEAIVEFRKPGDGNLIVVPATPVDQDLLEDLPLNREGKMVVTFPRHLPFHKKYFALLRTILHYMDEDDKRRLNIYNEATMLLRMKLDLGLFTLYIAAGGGVVPEGQPVYIPDSISFASMDESKFARLYKDTITVAIGKYTPHQNAASMDAAVNALLRFE